MVYSYKGILKRGGGITDTCNDVDKPQKITLSEKTRQRICTGGVPLHGTLNQAKLVYFERNQNGVVAQEGMTESPKVSF